VATDHPHHEGWGVLDWTEPEAQRLLDEYLRLLHTWRPEIAALLRAVVQDAQTGRDAARVLDAFREAYHGTPGRPRERALSAAQAAGLIPSDDAGEDSETERKAEERAWLRLADDWCALDVEPTEAHIGPEAAAALRATREALFDYVPPPPEGEEGDPSATGDEDPHALHDPLAAPVVPEGPRYHVTLRSPEREAALAPEAWRRIAGCPAEVVARLREAQAKGTLDLTVEANVFAPGRPTSQPRSRRATSTESCFPC